MSGVVGRWLAGLACAVVVLVAGGAPGARP
jgi:hypothetical protein